jgi:hypothetical protein
MLVDAFLNWYFVYVVRARLVNQHGLRKYKPLVAYYTRLGVVSVCMDLMLIGLMSLPNGIVFVQFHPVAYVSHSSRPLHSLVRITILTFVAQMVKLNIEMSMADMIVKVARTSEQDMNFGSSSRRMLQTPLSSDTTEATRTEKTSTVSNAKQKSKSTSAIRSLKIAQSILSTESRLQETSPAIAMCTL